MSDTPIYNVFQPGLIRGAARLSFAPHKRYFYVEHPTEGWRVYLRSACFIHEAGVPFNPARFIVVKRFDSNPDGKVWEPPKGQMEGKDGLRDKNAPVIEILAENIRREVGEESKIENLHHLNHTGLVFQAREKDYPPNHYFQYHVFQAFITVHEIGNAIQKFMWLHQHPKAWERQRKDQREKDAIGWFDPHYTGLMGRWSPGIVGMYLGHLEG